MRGDGRANEGSNAGSGVGEGALWYSTSSSPSDQDVHVVVVRPVSAASRPLGPWISSLGIAEVRAKHILPVDAMFELPLRRHRPRMLAVVPPGEDHERRIDRLDEGQRASVVGPVVRHQDDGAADLDFAFDHGLLCRDDRIDGATVLPTDRVAREQHAPPYKGELHDEAAVVAKSRTLRGHLQFWRRNGRP